MKTWAIPGSRFDNGVAWAKESENATRAASKCVENKIMGNEFRPLKLMALYDELFGPAKKVAISQWEKAEKVRTAISRLSNRWSFANGEE